MKMKMTWSLPWSTRRAALPTVLAMAAAISATAGASGPDLASAAATPPVCKDAGVTVAMVQKVFGPGARLGGEGISESGRCPIESGVDGKPPSNCLDGLPECLDTDVTLEPASEFKAEVKSRIEELGDYGDAHEKPFPGAGPGAVLLTASDYGGVTAPTVTFEAGTKAVSIGGPFGGEGQTPKVYKQWEALARAIHKHLS
jgi:hypothetical protein